MTAPSSATTLDRWSGGCLIAAGLLILPGMLHPDIFSTTLADAALGARLWVPMHAGGLVATALTLIGLAGLYAPRAARLGRLGGVGFALVVPGLVMTGALAWAEAFLLPVISREHPELFGWDGPVTTSWAIRLTAGTALCWLVGLVLLGLALWRHGVLPSRAALTLTGAAAAWTVFGGLLLPVVGPLSTLALAIGYIWLGTALFTGATGRRPVPAPRPVQQGAGER